jgi:hypothetical protein
VQSHGERNWFDQGSGWIYSPLMRAPLLLALLIAACQPAGAALPPNAVILPGSLARTMLSQCSRATPPPGDGTWTPGEREIAALEAALPGALRGQPHGSNDRWSNAPQGWQRQYVGILRGGRRLIYGNYFPRGAMAGSMDDRWRHEAVMVCDGGPEFFGAEYDVEANRFSHFGFNGSP